MSHIDAKEKNPEITTLEAHPHDLSVGDYIKFDEVKGLTELNGTGPYKVTEVNTPFNFCIDANTKHCDHCNKAKGKYESGGFITEVKMPFNVKYKKFSTALE